METLQATSIMIKPDVAERDLLPELLAIIGACELTVVAEATIMADMDFVRALYGWETVRHPDHIEGYLCSKPMDVMVIVGDDAVAKALQLRQEFRGRRQMPEDRLHTLIHCPDSPELFAREFRIFTGRSRFAFRETLASGRASQVQVIPHAESNGEPMVLLVKRSEERGGFWQVVTGGVRPGENVMRAGFREVYEETGMLPMELCGPIYEYDFTEATGTLHEAVFVGSLDGCHTPTLSDEHTEYRWVSPATALEMLKWPGNKAAMEAFVSWYHDRTRRATP